MTRSHDAKPKVGVLLGDPCGIGPELVAKVLADTSFDPAAELILVGDERILLREMEKVGLRLELQVREDLAALDPDDPAIPFLSVPVTEIDLAALPTGTANEIGGRYAMGFTNAMHAGLDVVAPLYAAKTDVGVQFTEIRQKEGLRAALKWRRDQFAEYED